MEDIQDTLRGRMSPALSPLTRARISTPSLKASSKSPSRKPRCLRLLKRDGLMPTFSWETDGAWHTELLTRNISVSPNGAKESTLSQILQVNAPEKYSLSARACNGILNRVLKHGKKLPEVLREALMSQSMS